MQDMYVYTLELQTSRQTSAATKLQLLLTDDIRVPGDPIAALRRKCNPLSYRAVPADKAVREGQGPDILKDVPLYR